jgi:hypothetical protein
MTGAGLGRTNARRSGQVLDISQGTHATFRRTYQAFELSLEHQP